MQQSEQSRYLGLAQETDTAGRIFLADREPFVYAERTDNIVHTAVMGDTWFNLAQRYYRDISLRASGLWWVLCDFQPQPVVDPTLAIPPGSKVYLPSPLVVQSEVLGVVREESV